MRVLFIGDIVGRKARNFAPKKIVELKDQLQLDAVIVNVENAAGGFGVTPSICDDFFSAGADVLTTGNHVWDKREIISYISKSDRLLRPLNMIKGTPGLGMTIIKIKSGTISVFWLLEVSAPPGLGFNLLIKSKAIFNFSWSIPSLSCSFL